MGLLAPSELLAQTGTYSDWHSDFWANRFWGSTITTSYVDPQHLFKRVQVQSVTGRYTLPGIVAVACTTKRNGNPYWTPGWKSAWGWRIQWAKSWTYGSGNTWTWAQIGWHNWNTQEYLRSYVGPITW